MHRPVYLDRVKEYDKSKSEIDIQLDVINDVNRYINSKGQNSGTVPSLALLNDPTLAALLSKLYDAEFQLQRNKSIAGEKSDLVILSEDEVKRLRTDIKENVTSLRRNLLSARNNVTSTIGASTSMLSLIPQKNVV